MSVLEKQISLFASFKAFVSENPKEKQKNIGCTPFYRKYSKKSQEFEVLLLSNPSNHIIIPAVNYSTEDKIQFVFQKLTTNEFLGSISFTTDLFSSVPQKEFSQWFLFSIINCYS